MFDVKVVELIESSGKECKCGIGTVVCYGSMGDRVCKRHQNIFNYDRIKDSM